VTHYGIVSGNPHVVTATELSLGNVDNIADTNQIILGTVATGDVTAIDNIGKVTSKADGDIFFWNTSLSRLGIGSDDDILTLASGIPSWTTPTWYADADAVAAVEAAGLTMEAGIDITLSATSTLTMADSNTWDSTGVTSELIVHDYITSKANAAATGFVQIGSAGGADMYPFFYGRSEGTAFGMYFLSIPDIIAQTGYTTAALYFNARRTEGDPITSGDLIRFANDDVAKFTMDYAGNVIIAGGLTLGTALSDGNISSSSTWNGKVDGAGAVSAVESAGLSLGVMKYIKYTLGGSMNSGDLGYTFLSGGSGESLGANIRLFAENATSGANTGEFRITSNAIMDYSSTKFNIRSGKNFSFTDGGSVNVINTTFVDNDTSLMTSQAIKEKIEDYGYSTTVGTVTSVTGTAPVVSSEGTTPAISMAVATTSVNGYLTSTDWNTFNGKVDGAGAVSAVNSTGIDLATGKGITIYKTHSFGAGWWVGINSSGTVYKAQSDSSVLINYPCIGVTTANNYIMISGVYTTSGLDAGEIYSIDATEGTITTGNTEAYLQRVGVALSTTQILVMPSLDVITT